MLYKPLCMVEIMSLLVLRRVIHNTQYSNASADNCRAIATDITIGCVTTSMWQKSMRC